ncbi:hypothetical protein DAPPUDRAFT_120603 [Daphnia pulex]|uniref:Uncharacterized protein n=1 Tax=Daphnia pulex TaxID=6669 RepID=E9I1U0_DAPPU|nr:hypothetical protein DAPPUDRAFT_120603 [Daphnia pulex]|eukprot:EFX62040.1 hypothetical protein DAPPUDRAFT_120603 [Daphnia pulex]
MASIFASPTSLSSVYNETSVAEINAATTVATAKLLYVFKGNGKFNFFSNDLDTEVGILLAHPNMDDVADTTKRLLWLKIPAERVINFSVLGVPWYEFDAGTKLYIYRTGTAATQVRSSSGSGNQDVVVIGGGQVADTSAIDTTGSEYQEALAVATGVETNILVYVVPATPIFHAVRFEFGGGNIATYYLYVNGVKKAQFITWWNTGMNGVWDFKSAIPGGLIIEGGSQINRLDQNITIQEARLKELKTELALALIFGTAIAFSLPCLFRLVAFLFLTVSGELQDLYPLRSEIDGLDERVHTKIVDYTDPSGVDKQVTVNDTLLHVKSHGALTGGGFGALQLSETGSIIHKGVYDGTTNTIPANTGIIGHARAATPGDSDQTIRLTAGNPSADNVAPANIFALDTNGFLHGFDGTNWDRITATAGSLNVNITNPLNVNIAGVYDVGTNPTPDNVGIILNVRAAAPDDTTQTFRPTGGSPTADDIVSADTFGIDTNSFGMVYDGTAWDRLLGFSGRAGVAATFTTSTKPAGRYRIALNWTWSINVNNQDAIQGIYIDNTLVDDEMRQELSETANQRIPWYRVVYVDFVGNTTHTIELRAENIGMGITTDNRTAEPIRSNVRWKMNLKPENYAKLAMQGMIIESCDDGFAAHHDLLKGVLGFGNTRSACIEDYQAAVEQWYTVHTNKGRSAGCWMSVLRRPSGATPNRDPMKWEVWALDLSLLRSKNPSLDVDPDKDARPYLIISDTNYTSITGNCTCLPLSSQSFLVSYEEHIQKDSLNNLKDDSWVHCHAIQTLEKTFLRTRIGILQNNLAQNSIIKKLKAF